MSDHPNPPVDNTETDLALLEETMRSLPVPAHAAEIISDGLNFLYENGADDKAEVLEDIHRAASAMLQTTQQINQGFGAALHIAKSLREQREEARQALSDLRKALDQIDLDHEDVAAVWEAAEECFNEDQLWYIFDLMYEEVAERIYGSSPLLLTEAHELLDVLTGGRLDEGHYLWDELRGWMRRARETADTGICPPAAAD